MRCLGDILDLNRLESGRGQHAVSQSPGDVALEQALEDLGGEPDGGGCGD